MKKICLILIMLVISLTACDKNPNTVNNTNAGESISSDSIYNMVKAKKDQLDLSDNPFSVCAVYQGTMFDYNNDGIDDYTFAYGLYAQYQFVIIDGATADYLFDDRIMMDFSLDNITTELYIGDNNYLLKSSSKIIKTATSALTETIQYISNSRNEILEAVYDENTGDFIHAYDKYTYDEYIEKQNELLDGFEYYMKITWSEYL